MPLQIIRNDITKVRADVIVNTANPEAAVGAGVDSAIYKAAGYDRLLSERKKIGRMKPGEAKETPAFDLPAKYIIHTVGPAWLGGDMGEADTVAKCYRNSLELALKLGCESIAFPLISTGTLGFPKDLALRTAISEITDFLLRSDMNVFLVVYNKEAFELSGKLFEDVRSYIEESQVISRREMMPNSSYGRIEGHIPDMADLGAPTMGGTLFDLSEASVEDLLEKKGETFQQHLFRLIDRKGLDDIEVYKKANLDRKLFSKIKGNVNYNPSKRTAVALAISLELNEDEALDLLGKAGYTFSDASKADIIVRYFIERGEYDINEINCCLFEFGQQILGA